MNKILIIVIVVILAGGVLGGVWWLSKKTPVTTTTITTTTTTTTPTAVPVASTGNVVEVTIEGSEFKFVPNKIEAKKGDTVRVMFKNSGTMSHDFVIDEFGVATNQLGEGEDEEVEFVPDKTGTFNFYCSVGDHRAKGMQGTLLVTP